MSPIRFIKVWLLVLITCVIAAYVVNPVTGKREASSDYFQHWLVRGLLGKEMGKASLAEEDIQHAEDLLPTSSAAYALAEGAEFRGDMQTVISYYAVAAGSGGEIGQLASTKIVRYDLPSIPGNCIAPTITIDRHRRMIALVRNNAGVQTSNIKVSLPPSSSGLSRDYDIRGSLEDGQQGSLNTGIVADPSLCSLRVIQATPR